MIEAGFRRCAEAIGVEGRIAVLASDCARALASLPADADPRWRARLEDQHQRLLDPDLRVIVAVTTSLAEETPALAPLVSGALAQLVRIYPGFMPFHARLASVGGADATASVAA